jgi:NADPH:quinone reductase
MRAWRAHELGEPDEVLRLDEDVPEPTPGDGEVLVEVEAAALNFADVLLCQGRYQERPSAPFTPGFEIAGRVRSAAGGLVAGQRVAAMCEFPDGGFAERTAVPVAAAQPIPDELPAVAAAAMVITYRTAHAGLHRRAGVRAGETVLVHAGAGGVGSATIQVAKAAGARVIATAGGAEKLDVCRRLGADEVIDYRTTDFVEPVLAMTDGRGADVIVDPVGGDVFDRSRKVIAFEGRIVVAGFAGGRVADAPTNHALVKNYSVVGLHWGLYRRRAPGVVAETHTALMDLYRAGLIDPLVSEVIALPDVPAALRRLSSRDTVGKLVTTFS